MTTHCFTADNTEGYSAADLDALNVEFERACMELDIDAEDADTNESLLDAVAERILTAYDARNDAGERWYIIAAYNTAPIAAWGTPQEADQYVNILNVNRVVNVYAEREMTLGSVAALELSARVDDGLNLRDELLAQEASRGTEINTIRIAAVKYEDHDDCLTAAAADVAAQRGLHGWDLAPRWEDDQREYILVTVPQEA